MDRVERAGEGPPVLVIHGSPGGSDQGLVLGQFLVDAGFEVIAPSRPGYLGEPLEGRESIDAQADLLNDLLNQMGIPRLPVFAWSGGGPAAYRMAVRHPHRVSALGIFSGVSTTYQMHQENAAERWVLSSRLGNWLIRTMARRAPKQIVASTLKAEGSLTKSEVKERTKQVMAGPRAKQFIQHLAETVNYRPERRPGFQNDTKQFAEIESLQLEKITAPTIVAHGDADTDVPFEQGQHAASAMPEAKFVRIERGTHVDGFTHPTAPILQRQVVDLFRTGT